MQETPLKTLIIGGGISGIAAARTLAEGGDMNFLVLTKDIGGRIIMSEDGETNYGAFYVRKDYKHIFPYIETKRKLHFWTRIQLFYDGAPHKYSLEMFKHLIPLFRYYLLARKFKRHYLAVQKATEFMPQKEACEADPFIYELYNTSATDLVKKLRLEYWAKHFLYAPVRATTFLNIRDIHAFALLTTSLPWITPTYELGKFHWDRLIEPFKKNIVTTTVTNIKRHKDSWCIGSEDGSTYTCDNLVLALPIDVVQRLYPQDIRHNPPVSVFMTHLRGTIRAKYKKGTITFLSPEDDDIVFVHEPNKTILFYSRNENADLAKYFTDFSIIKKMHWNPAFFLGSNLIPSDYANNLTIIGDNNACLMEACYIQGKYAAHKILGRTK